MEINLKKATIGLLALGLALPVFAQNNKKSYNGWGYRWGIQRGLGFQAGFSLLQPSNSGLGIGFRQNGNDEKGFSIDTDYHVAYELGATYGLKNSYLQFLYKDFGGNDSSTASGGDIFFRNKGPFGRIEGHHSLDYHLYNFIAGHFFPLTDTFGINLDAGLQYGKFSQNLMIAAFGAPYRETAYFYSDFHGIGPELSIMGVCRPFANHAPNLSVTGGIVGSLLYGDLDSRRQKLNGVIIQAPSDRTTVTTLDTKLGLSYTFHTANIAGSINGGWNFYTAMDAAKFGKRTHNIDTQGPYFDFTVSPTIKFR